MESNPYRPPRMWDEVRVISSAREDMWGWKWGHALKTGKSPKNMVGAVGIEPTTPPV